MGYKILNMQTNKVVDFQENMCCVAIDDIGSQYSVGRNGKTFSTPYNCVSRSFAQVKSGMCASCVWNWNITIFGLYSFINGQKEIKSNDLRKRWDNTKHHIIRLNTNLLSRSFIQISNKCMRLRQQWIGHCVMMQYTEQKLYKIVSITGILQEQHMVKKNTDITKDFYQSTEQRISQLLYKTKNIVLLLKRFYKTQVMTVDILSVK